MLSTRPISKLVVVALVTSILLLVGWRPALGSYGCEGANNGSPTAGNDKAILYKPYRSVLLNPLRLAADPDNCPLTIVSVETAKVGVARITSFDSGLGPYFPTSIYYEYAGAMTPATDHFNYTIRNSKGLTATGTITVLLYQDLRPPIAADYTISTVLGEYRLPINVVINSSDPDGWDTGRPMHVVGVEGLDLEVATYYIHHYHPENVYFAPRKVASTSFYYVLRSEATGLMSRGKITIIGRNGRPPIAPDYTVTAKPGHLTEIDVLSKASDPDVAGAPVYWAQRYLTLLGLDEERTPPPPGQVFNNDHSIFFTPNLDASGPVVLYYRIQTNAFWDQTATGKITILVQP